MIYHPLYLSSRSFYSLYFPKAFLLPYSTYLNDLYPSFLKTLSKNYLFISTSTDLSLFKQKNNLKSNTIIKYELDNHHSF